MSGFQLSGDAPTIYNRVGLKLLEPWTEDLIVSGKVRDGDRVLDLACGTGVVAGRVKSVTRKLCTVVGLDINEAMLGAARRIPDVEWQQGSVLKMPFSDSSFDVVLLPAGTAIFSGSGCSYAGDRESLSARRAAGGKRVGHWTGSRSILLCSTA